MRSAEKPRTATGQFANDVANFVLCKRLAVISSVAESLRPQVERLLVVGDEKTTSVISAFVAVNRKSAAMTLLSLAVGTKHQSVNDNESGLRDCHAEILSRRSLKRFVAHDSHFVRENCWVSDEFALVMYVSSTPCGNASIKRWYKPKTERWREDLRSLDDLVPLMEEQRERFHHYKATTDDEIVMWSKRSNLTPCQREFLKREAPWLPEGLQPHSSRLPRSCSDKMARWIAEGLIPSYSIPLEAVVVGRKFSRGSLERALLFRAKDHVSFPALLCTDVKLFEGGYQGANFQRDGEDFGGFCWWIEDRKSRYEVFKKCHFLKAEDDRAESLLRMVSRKKTKRSKFIDSLSTSNWSGSWAWELELGSDSWMESWVNSLEGEEEEHDEGMGEEEEEDEGMGEEEDDDDDDEGEVTDADVITEVEFDLGSMTIPIGSRLKVTKVLSWCEFMAEGETGEVVDIKSLGSHGPFPHYIIDWGGGDECDIPCHGVTEDLVELKYLEVGGRTQPIGGVERETTLHTDSDIELYDSASDLDLNTYSCNNS